MRALRAALSQPRARVPRRVLRLRRVRRRPVARCRRTSRCGSAVAPYRSLRRAVELGDGWAPFGLRTAELAAMLHARARHRGVGRARRPHRRDPAERASRSTRSPSPSASPNSSRASPRSAPPASTSASCTTPPRTTANNSPPSPPALRRQHNTFAEPARDISTNSWERNRPGTSFAPNGWELG